MIWIVTWQRDGREHREEFIYEGAAWAWVEFVAKAWGVEAKVEKL